MSLSKIMTEAKHKLDIEQGLQKLTHKDQHEQLRRKQATDQYYADLRVQQGQNQTKRMEQVEREHMRHQIRNMSEANAQQDNMLKRLKMEQQEQYRGMLE